MRDARRERALERARHGSSSVGDGAARVGPLGVGDLPAWLALFGVIAAVIFGGLQARETARQSEQTERALSDSAQALNASTATSIYQEEREVNQLVTPRLWPYFKEGARLPPDNPQLARQAYVVAGAILDHFEHLRGQVAIGAFNADREAWGAYITWSFRHSPLLCSELRSNLDFYGDEDDTVWGQWGEAVCGPTSAAAGWIRCGTATDGRRGAANALSFAARAVPCRRARSVLRAYFAFGEDPPDPVVVQSYMCAEEFGGERVTCKQGERLIRSRARPWP